VTATIRSVISREIPGDRPYDRALTICTLLGIDPDAPEGSGRWVTVAQLEAADALRASAVDLLILVAELRRAHEVDNGPPYDHRYGRAHHAVQTFDVARDAHLKETPQ